MSTDTRGLLHLLDADYCRRTAVRTPVQSEGWLIKANLSNIRWMGQISCPPRIHQTKRQTV